MNPSNPAHPSRPVEGTETLKAKIAAMVGWNLADGDPLDVLLSALSAPQPSATREGE